MNGLTYLKGQRFLQLMGMVSLSWKMTLNGLRFVSTTLLATLRKYFSINSVL